MFNVIHQHVDNAISEYTRGPYSDTVLEARKQYIDRSGMILDEDDEEYESRINCFQEWYLFQYQSKNTTTSMIQDYLAKNNVDQDLSQAFLTLNYSLFEYQKMSFGKQMILKDILHDKKITLAKKHPPLSIMASDVFVGRVITYQDQSFMLRGLCVFPSDIHSALKKEAKKVRKLKDIQREHQFLLRLEGLKSKWLRYGQVDTNKFFLMKGPAPKGVS